MEPNSETKNIDMAQPLIKATKGLIGKKDTERTKNIYQNDRGAHKLEWFKHIEKDLERVEIKTVAKTQMAISIRWK